MPFNANNFRAELKYGGARPNMFEITLVNPPQAFKKAGGGDSQAVSKITYMANSADLPGSVIGTIPVPYFGRIINVAGDRMFEDWNCAIYTDEDFITRNSFEAWNNMMAYINYDTNREHGAAAELISNYVCDIEVKHFTKTGKVDKIYILKNAFPYVVSPVQLSWQANDQIMMFQVTWKYDYFITNFDAYTGTSVGRTNAEASTKDAP